MRRTGTSGSAAAVICGAGGSGAGAGAGAAGGAGVAGTAAGRTTTGVAGGTEATAAPAGRVTTAPPGRGGATTGAGRAAAAVAAETNVGRGPVCGITRLGATGSAGASIAGAGLAAMTTRAAAGAPALAGGATATAGGAGRAGGADLAAASAFLRSRMSLRASPGLLTPERLIAGSAFAGAGFAVPAGRMPLVSRPRTFSASSSSMELECVFFSVTPTAVRASRISLLLTSSSRARSLMRTLLIQSFFQGPAIRAQVVPLRG